MTRKKIPIADQIEEARRHRDEIEKQAAGDETLSDRLDRAEGIVLTLAFVEAYEQGFRDYFAARQKQGN
jgi:alpha-glucuronidase